MKSPNGKLSFFALLVLLAISPQLSDALRILGLFPFHGRSHFVMNGRLMRGLAERGHQVDVYSHFPLKKPIANYTDYSLHGPIEALKNNMDYNFFKAFSGSVSIPGLLNLAGEPICDLMNLPVFQKLINNPPNDPPYDVVIVETFFANCYLAFGRHLNVPMVVVATTNLFDWMYPPLGNPSNPAVDPNILSKFIAPMTFFERVQNVLLTFQSNALFHYKVRGQDAIVRKIFGPGYPDVIELQKDAALTLLNHHHAVYGIRPHVPGIVPIGGLHIVDSDEDLPKDVQKFLDESKDGFIYFSFGSMVRIETFPKTDLDAIYGTFKKIAPVRVLLKIAKPEELPPGLPSNVITHSWLPQVKVLKHKNIKAFITHGGLMGTLEAIYHGVPLIGFALFGDQHVNIESYARKNLAIKLDAFNIKEETFSDAVFEIIKNPIYKKSAEEVGRKFRDVPMSPMDTAAFWIEYVARHGKNVLRSPIVDMPWWQVYLLDVYGFIILVILAVLYVLKITFKNLFRIFSSNLSKSANCKSKVKKN